MNRYGSILKVPKSGKLGMRDLVKPKHAEANAVLARAHELGLREKGKWGTNNVYYDLTSIPEDFDSA